MKSILSVLIFSVSYFSFCFGQKMDYKSRQITIENGLAHNTVECVFKDSDGFMWFGTHNGLNRYDGTQIKTYQNIFSDSNSISGNKVISINEDAYGNLWFGTSNNGLNRFDKEKELFYRYKSNNKPNSLPNNMINNIKLFSNNKLWVCTANGLALYNETTDDFITYFPADSGLQQTPFFVFDAIEMPKGDIYVATNSNYLFKLNAPSGVFTKLYYSRNSNLPGNYRKHLALDNSGNIWISAFAHGLVRFNPTNGKSAIFTPKNKMLNTDLLNGNLAISNNKLWLTTDGYGIVIFDCITEEFSSITSNQSKYNGLFSNKIYSIFIDDQQIIWAGTFDEGVNILDPNQLKFDILKTSSEKDFSLKGMSVVSIFEDSKNRIWIGTDGMGLFQYSNQGEVRHFLNDPNNQNSLSSDRIICIKENENGELLLGTYMGGLTIFNVDKNKFTRFLPENGNPNSISSNHVWDILIDSDKKIWLGLLGTGLDLFDAQQQKFSHFGSGSTNSNRLNHDNVMGIIEDKEGNIWFGTDGMGINILDKKSGTMLYSIFNSKKISLSNNNVRCVYEDSDGIIWLGTENGGLNRYNKKTQTVECFYASDGLPSNIIYSITEDNNKNLWLGTAYGVSKFSYASKTFKNYDVSDGLQGYICNRNAIYKRHDGSILVGTTNGLSIFHPDSIVDLKITPDVFFTDLRIQNKIVLVGDTINGRVVLKKGLNFSSKIVITPKDKIFTIEFAAKTYTLPEKCQFQYMLSDFESSWKTTDAERRFVTYSNLNPGTYYFKVKASNSDGIWSANIKSLKIVVLPSFVQSIGFKFMIAGIILLLLYIGYRNKLIKKEKQFVREREAHEQEILWLEKDKLESELNNQTFGIINRNKTLVKHKRRLAQLATKVDAKNKATILDIIDEIDQEINDVKDWKHIEPRLDKVYNNFMTTLKNKHKNLTQNELRVAAYVRMGLSTKEISELFQKTTKAIDNERYRLRKKLEIPLNDSLKSYLLDL